MSAVSSVEKIPKNLKDFGESEFQALAERLGQPAYRGRQISKWVFEKGVSSFDEMTNLPKALRETLKENFTIGGLDLRAERTSRDGTRKFLFATSKGAAVETVLIPDGRRRTLCISTQAGCRMGCTFCVTGTLGLLGQLSSGDIVDQYLETGRRTGETVSHVVLMGMGEPLDNYDNVAQAVRTLTHPEWMGLSPRRVTLSTCGLVPAMVRFKEEFPRVSLAISLGAPDDERRNELIPVNRRYPLAALMEACRELPLQPRERITFEYILLEGVNDSAGDARSLARLVHGVRCKVNLIPFNPSPLLPYRRPGDGAVDRFARGLLARGVTVTVRKSRGRDIEAACGLLAGGPPGPGPEARTGEAGG
ncbi:MAG: 23S rRNA (adenine(2503)-C(2))-methyltransferase RlmN [Nitrospinota bacterium]